MKLPVFGAVVVLALLSCGEGAAIHKSGIRKDLCQWGAQYWCSSPKTATLCGKTEWCSENYWPYKLIQDYSCNTAQKLIKTARYEIFSSEEKIVTDHDFARVLAKACTSVKDERARQQCKTALSDENILLKLLQLVDSKLPTQTVAEAVGMCKRKLPIFQTLPVETKPCRRCHDVVTGLRIDSHKFLSQDLFMNFANKYCMELGGPAKAVCLALAQSSFNKMMDGIMRTPTEKVCTGITKCFAEAPKSVAMDECTFCKDAVNDLKNLAKDQEFQAIIRRLWKLSCDFTGDFKELCLRLADEGLTYLLEYLVTKLEPTIVCSELHMCTPKKLPEIKAPVPVPVKNVKGPVSCPLCEFAMKQLDSLITSNSTVEQIEAAVDQLCSSLPASLEQECETFVSQYAPILVQVLARRLDPSLVCQTIGLCKTSAVSGSLPKVTDSELCDLCKYVIGYLDAELTKNSSEAEIENALAQVCNILPDQFRAVCEVFVKQYTLQLINYVVNNFQPAQFCLSIGLCNQQDKTLVTKVIQMAQSSNDQYCETCKQVMAVVETFLEKNSTQEQIETLLEKVCTLFPSPTSSECKQLVDQYGPMIIQLLLSQIKPDQICAKLGLCNATGLVNTKLDLPSQVGYSEECTLCQLVMKELDAILSETSTEADVKDALDKVCSLLPTTLSTQCQSFVDKYSAFILQILAAEMDPKKVCTLLRLCPPGTSLEYISPVNKQKTVICTICWAIVADISTKMQDNATEQEIIADLLKGCDLLVDPYRSLCKTTVQAETPQILKFLKGGLNPDQVCYRLSMCDSPVKSVTNLPDLRDGEFCPECTLVFQTVYQLLQENKTQEAVIKVLDKVCDKIPASIRDQCQGIIVLYFPYIVDLIVREEPPEEICKLIKLCNSAEPIALTPKLQAGEFCAICEFVMQELDQILKDNSTVQEIEAALEQVCGLLPASLKSQCDQFVEQYTPQLIQILVQLSPKDVCMYLGLCTGTKKVSLTPEPKAGELCAICEFLMKEIDWVLKHNSTVEEIKAALDLACKLLPASEQADCEDFLVEYAILFIQVLAQLPPEEVCAYVGLCTNGSKVAVIPELKAGEFCAICEFVMQELDQILKDNSTVQEIEAALEQVCGLLPASLKSQCDQFVEQYTPQLIQILVQLSPKDVCTYLGLCTGTKKVLATQKLKAGPQCVICEYVMEELDQILKENATVQEIEAALEQVCNLLPSTVKSECDAFVKQYAPVLISYLTQMPPKQVCSALGLCAAIKVSLEKPMMSVKAEAGPYCVICELVMQQLDQILKENATVQDIVIALDQVCSLLPSTLQTECTTFVKQYAPVLVGYLVQIPPKQVCTKLQLCAGQIAPLKVEDGPQCVMCEYVMDQLDQILKKNATVQEIEAALEQVCNLLPSTVKSECDAFIQQYTPVLISYLTQMPPKQVCSALGLCSANKVSIEKPIMSVKAEAGPYCVICELVMQQLDQILKENATVQDIVIALDQVCSLLPSTLQTECATFVQQYAPVLVGYLVQIPPKQVCTKLQLCAGQKTPLKVKAGPQCVICEFVMQELDQILKENSTIQEIEAALQIVCNLLPSSVKTECDTFVQQYAPILVGYLVQFPPKQVCTILGLCTAQKVANGKFMASVSEGGQYCAICEMVMIELDYLLKDNATVQEIETALQKVCALLPNSVKADCDTFVQKYAPVLVGYLLKFTPQEVCVKLELCIDPKVLKAQVGPQCSLCEYVIQELDKILGDNATVAEIEAALDQVCALLPSTVKDKCDEFIKTYFPTLVAFLVNMSPNEICSALGLCAAQKASLKVEAGPQCVICEYVMEELDQILKENATVQEIEAALEQVCNLLPSTVKSECDAFVQQYAPVLISYLTQMPPKQVCSALGLCAANKEVLKLAKPVNVQDGQLCAICEFAMQELDQILKKNATEKEIAAALDKLCTLVPTTLKSECDYLIQQFAPVLIEYLTKIPPKQVCTTLGFCTKNREAILKLAQPVQVKDDQFCAICEFAMQELDQILKENSTVQEIVLAVDQVCDLLPTTLKEECNTLVKQYAPILVGILAQLPPKQVCTAIGLCTAKKIPAPPKLKDTQYCDICEFAMQYLDQMLNENSTVQEIEAALEQVCSLLPSTVKSECDQFVQRYTPQLIQILVQLSPKDVCTYLGLCTGKKVALTPKLQADQFCAICEFVMQELDQILKDNSTVQEIEAALEQVCGLLPASLKSQCDQFVEQYTPQLIQILVQLSPKDVCTYLGLCTGTKKVSSVPIMVQNDQYCSICEFAMQYLDQMLNENSTVQEIEAALEQVCSLLPSTVKSECDQFVQRYTPQLIQILVQLSPKDVCTYLGLCTGKQVPVMDVSEAVEMKAGPQCALCEFIMNELDQLLSENATQEEIRHALDMVCNYLPASLKDQCLAFVNTYAHYVVELILQDIKPKEICTKLGLCTAETIPKTDVNSPNSVECVLCEYVMEKLETMISDKSTEAEIQAALDKVCSLLPSSLSAECKTFVDTYSQLIIDLLVQQVPPQKICASIGLCSATTQALKSPNSVECVLCEYVMEKLETMISDKSTEAEIQAALDKVCSLLPSSLSAECKTFVDTYSQLIIDLLVQEVPPQKICASIGLCSATNQALKSPNSVECVLCEYVMEKLETMISDKSTEAEIQAALDKVCSLLPSSLSAECKTFVDTYSKLIIDLLVQQVPPQKICVSIGLCSATNQALKSPNSVECVLCEYVMEKLETMISDKSTEAEIQAALDKVCSLLPSSLSAECKTFVDTYSKLIIDLLVQQVPPQKICASIGLCSATTQALKSPNSVECVLCEYVMEKLETMISDKSTEAEIQAALDKVCSLLPSSLSAECKTFVDTYSKLIIDLLVQEVPPQKICASIGLCSAKVEKVEAVDKCEICHLVMSALESVLKQPVVEVEVEKALDGICDTLPSNYKTACTDLVAMYAPTIVKYIAQGLDPTSFCEFVKLCASQELKAKPSSMVFVSEKQDAKPAFDGKYCTTCKFILYDVQTSMANSEDWQTEAKRALFKLCDMMIEQKEKCAKVVHASFPKVLNDVEQFRFPITFCQDVQLCEKP